MESGKTSGREVSQASRIIRITSRKSSTTNPQKKEPAPKADADHAGVTSARTIPELQVRPHMAGDERV